MTQHLCTGCSIMHLCPICSACCSSSSEHCHEKRLGVAASLLRRRFRRPKLEHDGTSTPICPHCSLFLVSVTSSRDVLANKRPAEMMSAWRNGPCGSGQRRAKAFQRFHSLDFHSLAIARS